MGEREREREKKDREGEAYGERDSIIRKKIKRQRKRIKKRQRKMLGVKGLFYLRLKNH